MGVSTGQLPLNRQVTAGLCLAILASSTGCSTWHTVETAPNTTPDFQSGELVRLIKKDFRSVELVVTSATPDTIFGSLRSNEDSTLAIALNDLRQTDRFQARDRGAVGLAFVTVAGLVAVITFNLARMR